MSQIEIVKYMLYIDCELELAYDLYQKYLVFNQIATINNVHSWLDKLIYKFKCSNIREYLST